MNCHKAKGVYQFPREFASSRPLSGRFFYSVFLRWPIVLVKRTFTGRYKSRLSSFWRTLLYAFKFDLLSLSFLPEYSLPNVSIAMLTTLRPFLQCLSCSVLYQAKRARCLKSLTCIDYTSYTISLDISSSLER